jgi:hypothetical protein
MLPEEKAKHPAPNTCAGGKKHHFQCAADRPERNDEQLTSHLHKTTVKTSLCWRETGRG